MLITVVAEHVPMHQADILHKKGVDKVIAVTVDEPGAVKDLAEKAKLKCSKV